VNSWKVILATMLIFGTGVVTGGLLVRHSEANRPPRPPRNPGQVRTPQPLSPQVMRVEFLRRAEKDLDLTPGQHERVEQLLKESQDRTRKLMEPVAPQLRQELARTREAFRELLTPEQRVRFDEMVKHLQRPQRRPGGPTNTVPENPANAAP
jgi:hypothetical protein